MPACPLEWSVDPIERLSSPDAVFGVVGLGYVGLPLLVEMAKSGHHVVGFELDADKVAAIEAGQSYIPDVPTDELADVVSRGLVRVTCDFSHAERCDVVVLCVPTPLNKAKEPDVSFMVAAAESVAPHLRPGQLVTLESTTYPGTTEELILPIVESSGLTVGEDVFLAFSPERVDPGNPVWQTKNTPRVVGGVTPRCTEVATAFYSTFLDSVVPVSTARAAEMSKILENTFRCVNIALMNELVMLCDRMDIDLWEVVDAAKTKPFGFMPFFPGPGLGGHCIPIDPFYLAWKAREYDFHTQFIEMSGRVNENMPYYVVERAMEALNGHGKALSTSRVLVLGVAYKPDIDDMRESPAIKVIELLRSFSAQVVYHDPYVPEFHSGEARIEHVDLTADELSAADLVLVLTAHRGVDYALVAEHAPLVLDTRNALAGHRVDTVIRL